MKINCKYMQIKLIFKIETHQKAVEESEENSLKILISVKIIFLFDTARSAVECGNVQITIKRNESKTMPGSSSANACYHTAL